jgi:hypothetical protein
MRRADADKAAIERTFLSRSQLIAGSRSNGSFLSSFYSTYTLFTPLNQVQIADEAIGIIEWSSKSLPASARRASFSSCF